MIIHYTKNRSNLRPFGAPPSIGRRECPRKPLPLEGAAERSEAGLASFLRRSRLLLAFPIGEGGPRSGARVLSFMADLRRSPTALFHHASPSNLRPYGAPPSIGRREKSESLSFEGKCVSNRWKMRVPLSPYCHFERSEKSSLHTGQTKEVRGAVNTVPYTTWNDGLPHRYCFPACKKDRGLRSG